MTHQNSNDKSIQKETLEIDPNKLIGKQSVRTTFRLSKKMIELLKIAANHLGIKQKTLIDQLLEGEKVLTMVAEEAQTHDHLETNDRRQKTFVLSRRALDVIEKISADHEIPRDLLLEMSIARLVPYVESQIKIHDSRGSLLKEIEEHQAEAKKLLKKAEETLNRDDQFKNKLERIVNYTEKNLNEMRRLVKDKKEFTY